MKINSILAALICLMLTRTALAIEMPSEIPNVSLGMTLEKLISARPNVKWMTFSGEKKIDLEKFKTGTYNLSEKLPSGGVFQAVGYGISDGKVVTVSLVSDPQIVQDKGVRKRVVKECTDRWGKAYKKRIPEDARRPGNPRPMLTWEIDGTEITLMLPLNRKKGDSKPNGASMQFRLISNVQKAPWKEMKLSDAEKKAIFESHDVIEK